MNIQTARNQDQAGIDNWSFYGINLDEMLPEASGLGTFVLLMIDDEECQNEQLARKLCLDTLPIDGRIPLNEHFNRIVVYYTDFDVAEEMFDAMRTGAKIINGSAVPELKQVDAILLDVLDAREQAKRGETILKALPDVMWSPMPGILLATGNKDPDLVRMTKEKGFSNYTFPVSKKNRERKWSAHDKKSLKEFYDYVIQRKSSLDRLGDEYGVVVGRHFRNELDEFLSLFELDRDRQLPLVIRGESGVGKELVARRIHARERWYDAQLSGNNAENKKLWSSFQPVLLNAIDSSVLSSELFGYEKGAFSGADKGFQGYIRKAEKGTLFIDEVADLPPKVQAGLLRFLQEGTIQVMGNDEEVKVDDVRLVFATNKPLDELRQDFIYRMDGLTFVVKSLAQRHEDDLRELIAHFLATNLCQYREAANRLTRQGQPIKINENLTAEQFLPDNQHDRLMEMIVSGCFPGNIRQLQAYIRRLTLLTRGERPVEDSDFEKASRYSLNPPKAARKAVAGYISRQEDLEGIFGDMDWNDFIICDRDTKLQYKERCKSAGLKRAEIVAYLMQRSLDKKVPLHGLTDTRGKPLAVSVVQEGEAGVLKHLCNLWGRNTSPPKAEPKEA